MTAPTSPRTSILGAPLKIHSLKESATTLILFVLLCYSWLTVAWSAWSLTAHSPHPWSVGDWLINYQSGIVRRGLLGEVVVRLNVDAFAAQQILIALQLLLLATLYTAAFTLFLRTSRSPAWLMLTASPAFLLFPVLSLDGALRKELLALVALVLLALAVSGKWNPLLGTLALVTYGISVFSHEATGLLLPAFCFLLWEAMRAHLLSRAMTFVWASVFAFVALLGMALAWTYPGTSEQVQAICASWTDRGAAFEVCTGAIDALDTGLIDAVQSVSLKFPDYFNYLPLALIALVPLWVLRAPRSMWILTGVLYVALLPVFLTGYDYGRWIYMVTGSVSIVALATSSRVFTPSREYRAPLIAAMLYVSMWSLPYTGPVIQAPLYGVLLEGPYHFAATRIGQALGLLSLIHI